jgi:glycosyltransferase involved in cell wall biosynthesis
MRAGRVLIVSENAPVPADRRVMNVARALVAADWEVVVACAMGEGHDDAPYEELDGIEIHRYPLRPASGAADYVREYCEATLHLRRSARRLAGERRFDVVHACNPPDFLLLAARSLRRQGTRLVFDHHDLVPELYRSRFGRGKDLGYRALLAMERMAFRLADVSLATNGSYARIAVQRGGMAPDDVFVVRNGPDLSRFQPVEPDPALKRGKRFLLGYLGIMGPQDGVDHAIRALAHLARRDDWHAVLVGKGESLDEMRGLARQLGIADRLEFTGWRYDDDIRSILSTCDVCLAPDPPSPLNDLSTMIKIPEYMAMGCPVVSYDLPESKVSAGEAAVYAAPGDPEDYARCIDELLQDPQRRERLSRAGREAVHDKLAWQHQIDPLLRAYQRALGADAQRDADGVEGRCLPALTASPSGG